MNGPLDEAYFVWLYSQVADPTESSPIRTFWSLTRQLHKKEFLWSVPNDDNRVEDGRDLRYEFGDIHGEELPNEWLGLGCSMLEMLIGLARRLEFEDEDGGDAYDWFWLLLRNAYLDDAVSDRRYSKTTERRVNEVLDRVIFRQYNRNGDGGLFPLHYPERDQRKVELWYQLSAYILERQQ